MTSVIDTANGSFSKLHSETNMPEYPAEISHPNFIKAVTAADYLTVRQGVMQTTTSLETLITALHQLHQTINKRDEYPMPTALLILRVLLTHIVINPIAAVSLARKLNFHELIPRIIVHYFQTQPFSLRVLRETQVPVSAVLALATEAFKQEILHKIRIYLKPKYTIVLTRDVRAGLIDLNMEIVPGETIFLHAIQKQYISLIQLCIEQKVSIPEAVTAEQNILTAAQQTNNPYIVYLVSLYLQSQLSQAACHGDLTLMKRLLSLEKSYINEPYEGETLLQRALHNKQFDVCIFLIAQGADVNAPYNEEIPLVLALYCKLTSGIVENPAFNTILAQLEQKTLLSYIIGSNNAFFHLLALKRTRDNTAEMTVTLHASITLNETSKLDALLSYPINVTSPFGFNRETALHATIEAQARTSFDKIVRHMTTHRVSFDIADARGLTALYSAAEKNYPYFMACLISNPTVTLTCQNTASFSAETRQLYAKASFNLGELYRQGYPSFIAPNARMADCLYRQARQLGFTHFSSTSRHLMRIQKIRRIVPFNSRLRFFSRSQQKKQRLELLFRTEKERSAAAEQNPPTTAPSSTLL